MSQNAGTSGRGDWQLRKDTLGEEILLVTLHLYNVESSLFLNLTSWPIIERQVAKDRVFSE